MVACQEMGARGGSAPSSSPPPPPPPPAASAGCELARAKRCTPSGHAQRMRGVQPRTQRRRGAGTPRGHAAWGLWAPARRGGAWARAALRSSCSGAWCACRPQLARMPSTQEGSHSCRSSRLPASALKGAGATRRAAGGAAHAPACPDCSAAVLTHASTDCRQRQSAFGGEQPPAPGCKCQRLAGRLAHPGSLTEPATGLWEKAPSVIAGRGSSSSWRGCRARKQGRSQRAQQRAAAPRSRQLRLSGAFTACPC
jgi:hypothetical protein